MTMAIFAGKLMYFKAFELQSRVFLKPWRETKIIIRCCSNTDFPVRYIPKRSSNLNKPIEPALVPKTKSDEFDLRRCENDDLMNVKLPNDRERFYLDEKSPDFKSGKLRSKGKNVRNSSARSDVLEHSYKWRSAESNSGEELHEVDAMEGHEDALDELDTHNGEYEIKHLVTEPSKKSPDFKSGLSTRKHDPFNTSDNLRSKGKKVCNSSVRSGLMEHNYNLRSAEANSVEELHEFDAMEGPEEALDELDSHNGEYEIKHLSTGPSESKEKAENTAIRLLAARAYTTVELKKKLSGKKFSPEVVNAVISDFQNRGLINDLLYAEAFSRSRWSSSSWGPRRIKQALAKKGVNDVDAQKAIKSVLEGSEAVDDDQVSRFGLSKSSFDHLFTQASKQWIRAKDLPTEKQKSRIITWLQYRGFNWGVINFILKRLQSEHPP